MPTLRRPRRATRAALAAVLTATATLTTATLVASGGSPAHAATPAPPDCSLHAVGRAPILRAATTGPRLSLPDGRFYTYLGRVLESAGGALLYVDSWRHIAGGAHPTQALSRAQFLATRQFPVNDTFVSASTGASTAQVYQFVDGKPMLVTHWSALGARHPVVRIDGALLDPANQSLPFPWDGVSDVPVDGDRGPFGPTFLRTRTGPQVWKLLGGAPVPVLGWSVYGGPHPTVTVDPFLITHRRTTTRTASLEACLRDGTFIRAVQNGQVYGMAGGAPIYVASPGAIVDPVDAIDLRNIDLCTPRPESAAMRFRPQPGTRLRELPNQHVWDVGATRIHDTGIPPGAFRIAATADHIAIINSGQRLGVFCHLPPRG